ncbi:MAG: hypothetical protein GC165_05310 [Armatimonadetes bacterium]|nr:hypothetical protein [Armatimonadota bacterium]
MITRREILKTTGTAALATNPLMRALASTPFESGAMRCINVVNFIREIEPRFKMDMMLPVTSQMELILKHGLPATWLLQFDALVSGPFVPYLKEHMGKNHEVGFWFEMNEKHVKAAGVEWRGRPGYEWDHLPLVAFTIGYTKDERIKLADTAMNRFKEIWGHYPKSIASWNLDSFTLQHLTEKYGVDAYAVCRDQIATDGFTIWGAPIAGYYPSKLNCWSPALEKKNQIATPIFRMLGQDPVYYYERSYPLPDGRRIGEPDTMEPAWTSGRSKHFVEGFLHMIADEQTGRFAYCQMGQENTFPWDQQKDGYPMQMEALAALAKTGKVHVETMGETGRRFKKAFSQTPVQTQVQLEDPFENTNPSEGSIWYQSRFYRANLHLKGDLPYLRDITVYSDEFPQPFLDKATRLNDVEQKMPPVLDGYHWRRDQHPAEEPWAGALFRIGETLIRATGAPKIVEHGSGMTVELPVQGGKTLRIQFEEKRMTAELDGEELNIAFRWDLAKSSLVGIHAREARYEWQGQSYAMKVRQGAIVGKLSEWEVRSEKNRIELFLAQS